jgi:hypothetical protein
VEGGFAGRGAYDPCRIGGVCHVIIHAITRFPKGGYYFGPSWPMQVEAIFMPPSIASACGYSQVGVMLNGHHYGVSIRGQPPRYRQLMRFLVRADGAQLIPRQVHRTSRSLRCFYSGRSIQQSLGKRITWHYQFGRGLSTARMGTQNHGLWHPSHGIVFSPSEQVLYPQLDLSRSIHGSAAAATEIQPRGASSQSGVDEEKSATGQEQHVVSNSAVTADSTAHATTGAEDGKGGDNADLEAPADLKQDKELEVEPPYSALDYRISPELFQEARKAPAGSPDSFWSYTLYRGPEQDGVEKRVKVHYCKSKHTMERVCQYFLDEPIIGFDMEWVPEANKYQGPRRNVSLIQIASQSRIALFHVALFPKNEFVADSFRTLMEDPDISKVGVAIKADCTRLRNFLGVDTKGIFELSHLYKLVKYSGSGQVELVNKRLVPLAGQVKEYLRLPLFKGQDVRSSDWAQPLNMDQIVCPLSPRQLTV